MHESGGSGVRFSAVNCGSPLYRCQPNGNYRVSVASRQLDRTEGRVIDSATTLWMRKNCRHLVAVAVAIARTSTSSKLNIKTANAILVPLRVSSFLDPTSLFLDRCSLIVALRSQSQIRVSRLQSLIPVQVIHPDSFHRAVVFAAFIFECTCLSVYVLFSTSSSSCSA